MDNKLKDFIKVLFQLAPDCDSGGLTMEDQLVIINNRLIELEAENKLLRSIFHKERE